MSEKKDKCGISYVEYPVTGWRLELEGNCGEVVEKVDNLPPGKKRYLKRRMVIKE